MFMKTPCTILSLTPCQMMKNLWNGFRKQDQSEKMDVLTEYASIQTDIIVGLYAPILELATTRGLLFSIIYQTGYHTWISIYKHR